MKYIYLTGSHSSGKSTLVNLASKDKRFGDFLILKEPIMPFIEMGYMFKIPNTKAEYKSVILSQMHLLGYATSVAEINTSLKDSKVMCDRSLFDVLTYIYFYAQDDAKVNKLLKTTGLDERIKKVAHKFNKQNENYLFLLEPVTPYEDNNFRLEEKYVKVIHNMIVDLYKKYNVEYFTLKDNNSPQERLNNIYKTIN